LILPRQRIPLYIHKLTIGLETLAAWLQPQALSCEGNDLLAPWCYVHMTCFYQLASAANGAVLHLPRFDVRLLHGVQRLDHQGCIR
jgi:hypothetical protein